MAKKQKKSAKKAAAKAAPKAKKTATKLGRRVQVKSKKLSLDRLLLNIASKQYARVLREVAKGRKRIDDEKKIALQLGERIIAKAREVKASLTSK